MKFEKLVQKVKRIALSAVKREIQHILEKAEKVPGVTAETNDDAVVLSGKDLKSRAVTDPEIRDIAR